MRASRVKLTEALTAAGLKTQAALAERIADLEELDTAPKDMVSRAFREMPMEVTSLERIARALDVPAHSLYQSSGEAVADEQANNRRQFRPWWLAVVALALGVLVTLLLQFRAATPTAESTSVLSLGEGHVVVMPLAGDGGRELTEALRDVLQEKFRVASATATATADPRDVRAVGEKLRADIVIDGRVLHSGRLSGITLFAYADGVRQQIWAEHVDTVALQQLAPDIAGRARDAILAASGDGTVRRRFPLQPVLEDYLAGEALLDAPANELNLRRAQGRFEAALRQDANYAVAHAGLCQTLLLQHWMFEEDRMLKDASSACSQALLLNPEHPAVASAHAHFLTRTGRNDEAIALYEQVNHRAPTYALAYDGLAAALLDGYRQTGEAELLTRAMEAARIAAETDPHIWKPLFNLATMKWFAGDTDAAISAAEAALARTENEYILGNLGTFYMCQGRFDVAKSTYQRARNIAPQSYVGDEFLGMSHHFLGEYGEAIRLRRRAISAIGEGEPEIHQMWGHLADSLRLHGDIDEAVIAYQRAAEIAERDYLRGTAPLADRADRAYYYLVLHSLRPDLVEDEVIDTIRNELNLIGEGVKEATAHRRMAQIWVLMNNHDQARSALVLATSRCPGYGMLPEFSQL